MNFLYVMIVAIYMYICREIFIKYLEEKDMQNTSLVHLAMKVSSYLVD